MKGGGLEKTGTLANIRQKFGTFTHFYQFLLVFTYVFVYFYIFTDILTKSYWARYSGGLGKKRYI